MLVERCDAWRSMRAKNMYSEKLRSMIPRPTRPANYIQVFQESQEVSLQIVVINLEQVTLRYV